MAIEFLPRKMERLSSSQKSIQSATSSLSPLIIPIPGPTYRSRTRFREDRWEVAWEVAEAWAASAEAVPEWAAADSSPFQIKLLLKHRLQPLSQLPPIPNQ